jgi:alpha-beta hydrolase superfamily lysophospholipase
MISIVATQKDTRKLIAGTYLEAPLVKIAAASGKWWQRAAARALRFLPKLKVPGAKLNRELLTRNETLKHRWSQDNVMVRTETFINTGNAFLDGEELIQNWLNAGNISFPFFLATGDEDIACDPQAGVDFFNRARSVNKKLKIYPNHRHNMKFDSDEVEADFVEWAKQIVKGE